MNVDPIQAEIKNLYVRQEQAWEIELRKRCKELLGTEHPTKEMLDDYVLETWPPEFEMSYDDDRIHTRLRVTQQYRLRFKTQEERDAEREGRDRESSTGESRTSYGSVELFSEGNGFENGSWTAPS